MKLTYIANVRMPTDMAHGIQIMNMCQAFAEAGLEVELIVPKRFNKIKTDPFEYYGIKKSFKITKLFCLDLLIFQLGSLSFLVQSFTFSLSALVYLIFFNHNIKNRILYIRSHQPGIFFNEFVMEVHTLPEKIKKIDLITWRKAKILIVLTKYIKAELLKYKVSEEKILVAADGVDLIKFSIDINKDEARRMLGLPEDKKIILYSGSFNLKTWLDWKGVDVVLETAKLSNQNYLFVLLGGEEKENDTLKTKFNLSNIKLIAHQEQKIIPYYLKAADILLLPNKKGNINSEKHTSPLKLFEYMASGTPIITSDLPSIREIMNEKNCLFFEANNPPDLAKKISLLLSDSELAKKIAVEARQDVNKYSWEKRAAKIINFLNR